MRGFGVCGRFLLALLHGNEVRKPQQKDCIDGYMFQPCILRERCFSVDE